MNITRKTLNVVTIKILPALMILIALTGCKFEHRLQVAKEEGPAYERLYEQYKIVEDFYNNDQTDSLQAKAPQLREELKKHKFWRLYYMLWEMEGEDLAFRNQYTQAMNVAHDIQQDALARECALGKSKAYSLMGTIYAIQENYEQSARCLKQAISSYDYQLGGRSELLNLYYRYTELQMSMKAPLQQADSTMMQWYATLVQDDPKREYPTWYFSYYDMRYTVLAKYGHYDQAEEALDSAEYYNQKLGAGVVNHINILNDHADIALHKGQYELAISYIERNQQLIDSLKQANGEASTSFIANLEDVRWQTLSAMGRYQEALQAKVRHDSLKQEMTDSELRQQTQELNKRYDIEEMKRQNLQLQQRSRFTTGGVAMVLGIIAMLVFLTTSNRWRHTLEVKNQQLERERNVVVAQNKQLSVERDRAEAASKAKTAFLQSMTHEIRTPLNAISGFTQVLAMPGITLPDAERQDFSNRIQENTRLLTTILDDLLLISNMEGNNQQLPPEECLPLAIINSAAEPVASQLQKGVKLTTYCSLPEEETIMSHPRLIGIILTKLLENAAKFTMHGTIKLSLERENGKLHFSVADTGPGIPADKQDFIFERFAKIDSFTQGAGLGLSIARMVAEKLGGTLKLDTTYNEGAKFDLILPINLQA